jgi:hypothetical protein
MLICLRPLNKALHGCLNKSNYVRSACLHMLISIISQLYAFTNTFGSYCNTDWEIETKMLIRLHQDQRKVLLHTLVAVILIYKTILSIKNSKMSVVTKFNLQTVTIRFFVIKRIII